MGLVASCVLSVTGCERVCKFCYGDDDQDSRWLRPCMCSGSLKWVHLRCFNHWMEKAPVQQQMQCQTCRYTYVKSWVLKPFSEWCRPAIKLSAWECIEIFLDTYSTYKFLRGFVLIIDGERSIVMQTLHFIFWRIFIATDRRLAYYASLIRLIMSSIFIISVKDCIPESEKRIPLAHEDEIIFEVNIAKPVLRTSVGHKFGDDVWISGSSRPVF